MILNAFRFKDPITLYGEKYYFEYSCAFDSISEVLILGYKYYSPIKSLIVENINNRYLKLLYDYIASGHKKDKFYLERANILFPFSEKKTDFFISEKGNVEKKTNSNLYIQCYQLIR